MKKIIPIAGLILSITATSVCATTEITKNEFDVTTGVLIVKGVTDSESGIMTLSIPKKGVTPAQLDAMTDEEASQNLLYCGQKSVGEDGAFEFAVTIPSGQEIGLHSVFLGHESGDVVTESSFRYIEDDTYESLNTAAKSGQSTFDAAYDKIKDELFYYPDVTSKGDGRIKKILCDYAKNVGFSKTDSDFNMSVYKTALAAQLLGEKKLQDAETLFDKMYIKNDGVLKEYNVIDDYRTYINSDEKRTYFIDILGQCNTIEEFEKIMTDSMILTVVKYSENVAAIQPVFAEYAEYTGAKVEKAGLSDYSVIMGNTYTSLELCVEAFNSEVNKKRPAGGGSGTGGGAGGGFGVVSPGGASATGSINIKFEDLNSVQWAYTAISELYEKNIISGRSETRFAPNDRVKREEYARMLVDLANIEVNTASNVFSDVEDGAWYKGYVNAAYKNGLCNGVSNGVFGAGMEISRQDMCVMAYNVLKTLGHEIPSCNLVFDDAAEFGEYAKAPVAALNKAGIVSGVGNNKFNPKGNATRAEAAVIIYKLLSYIG